MAEELRELRLSKQIPAKDMVAVVQAIYPKYDKTVQSKCENGDAYPASDYGGDFAEVSEDDGELPF